MKQLALDLIHAPVIWTAVIGVLNAVAIVTVPPSYQGIVAAVDILIAAVGTVITGQTVQAQRVERMQARMRALPTLDAPPTQTTAHAQSLWDQYPPPGPDKETADQDRSRART